ncbi:MAG: hypothetical protein LBE91_08835 [Tannerella sp.]|nr:hypothetical protein [Tannerella sp.]
MSGNQKLKSKKLRPTRIRELKKIIRNSFFVLLTSLPLLLTYCGNNTAERIKNQLRQEIQAIKSQCPQDQGNGLTITDANFHENEKIMEYVYSIVGLDSIDDATVEDMKNSMITAFRSEISGTERLSIKLILKNGYRYRYIYNDTAGNKLCEINITEDDLS